MSIEKQLLARFPIEKLLLVVTSGYTTIFMIPIDFIALLTGKPLFDYSACFQPFANLRYFTNGNAQEVAMLFAMGLAIGVVVLILYDVFGQINHLLKYVHDKEWTNDWKIRHWEEKKDVYEKEKIEFCDFSQWVRQFKLIPTFEYLSGLGEMTAGFLYASELVFVATGVVFAFLWVSGFSASYVILVISSVLLAVAILAYKQNKKMLEASWKFYFRKYKEFSLNHK